MYTLLVVVLTVVGILLAEGLFLLWIGPHAERTAIQKIKNQRSLWN